MDKNDFFQIYPFQPEVAFSREGGKNSCTPINQVKRADLDDVAPFQRPPLPELAAIDKGAVIAAEILNKTMLLILVDHPGMVPGDSRVIEPDDRLRATADIT